MRLFSLILFLLWANRGISQDIQKKQAPDSLPPAPVAILGTCYDSLLTVDQILASPYLSVVFYNSKKNAEINVIYYSLEITNHENESYFFEKTDNRLSPDILKIIKSLKPGSTLSFNRVKGYKPNIQARWLPGFKVTIRS